MPSNDAGAPAVPVCHAERTDDPAAMRWVCTSPTIGADGPRVAPGGVLGSLPLAAQEGALLVHGPADWAAVDREVRAALAERAAWLCTGGEAGAPSLATLHRLVADAVASLTESHGGGIEVVGIDGADVQVRLTGACHGCRFTDETLRRLAAPAVHRRYPGLTLSVVE
jgi:Fe-S cluster biogenesis protein NfuA